MGWSTGEPLTQAQINQLDENTSRAIDGTSGGTYSPAGVLDIQGSGIRGRVGACSVSGKLSLIGGDAGVVYRVDRTTLGDFGTVDIDVSHDMYLLAVPINSALSVGLNISQPGKIAPTEGQMIRIRQAWVANNASTGAITLRQDTSAGSDICIMPAPTSELTWVDCVFIGGAWRPTAHLGCIISTSPPP